MDLNGYNIYGSSDTARLLSVNNIRLVTLRWYYIALLAGMAALVSVIVSSNWNDLVTYGSILLLGYGANLLLLAAIKLSLTRLRAQQVLVITQLFADLAICGIVTYIEGGIDARTTILYAIPIVASGLMFSNRLVLPVATASSLMYVGAILAQTLIVNGAIDWVEYAVPVVLYPLIFLVLGRLVEFLSSVEINDVRERAYNSFLSLLAHQLKHPASASKTIIDVITHNKAQPLNSQTLHYMQMLKGENENQIRLIDNLLEAAPRSSQVMHLEPVDIRLLVEKAAHKTATAQQRLGDLARDKTVNKPVIITGNPIKLQLALTNIFDNSFRHTTDGAAVHYSIKKRGQVAEITIRDEGVGMRKEHLEKIAARFNASSLRDLGAGHVGGLGLGLYIAKQIIAAHDGIFNIQSEENKGTTVTIRIKGAKT